MINSIQHFQQDGVKRLIKIFEEYGKDITKMRWSMESPKR